MPAQTACVIGCVRTCVRNVEFEHLFLLRMTNSLHFKRAGFIIFNDQPAARKGEKRREDD